MKKMMAGTPATPSSKIQRTPCSTPGGSRVREEKILVTVRLRPLNRREQSMYDLIAWDCLDENTIAFKNPSHERPANPYTFGITYNYCWIKVLIRKVRLSFFWAQSCLYLNNLFVVIYM